MKTIIELAEKYNTDKKMNNGIPAANGLPGHNYAAIYDKYLSEMKVDRMLEIGIAKGLSLEMWNEYFDSQVEIHGLDIDINIKYSDRNKIHVHIGDQKDILFLNNEFNMEFDLIIDDGSHRMQDQQVSLKTLFPKLRSGGLYVIEDLHTSYERCFWNNPDDGKMFSTTLQLLLHLKLNQIYDRNYFNYIEKYEYNYFIDNIKSIEIHLSGKYIIGFITKK
jgi:hypothetical protein